MLHYAGITKRIGDVDDGDTVMDYMKQERERGITITSAAITFGWENHRINLIDTPGHVDFTIEVERSIRVLDGAVTILDAVSGVEAQTQTVWSQADRYDIPRIAYVNKMDRLGARFGRTVYEMYSKLQTRPLVCQLPVLRKDDYGNIVFSGVVDLLELEVIDWDKNPNGTTITRTPLTESYPQIPNLYSEAIKARSILVETLSESDDYLLEKFLETENSLQVSAKDIREAIRKATITCKVVPVFCGASFRNIGVQPLMDAVIDYLPSPQDRPLPFANISDDKLIEIELNENNKSCALAFKVLHDQKRGPMVFVRKIDNKMILYNTNTSQKERVNKLLQMYSNNVEEIPSIISGNIGVILGLKETRTGDTLIQFNDSRKTLRLQNIQIPAPVFFCAVEPSSISDEKPLEEALKNLLREDPSLHVHVDVDSGQTLISGMGELHLEIVKDRLLNEYKVNAEMGKMRISYRETLTSEKIDCTHLYDRELMGKRAKVQVALIITRLSEYDNGSPESVTKLSEEEIRIALRSGILSALYRGPILGFPLTRLHIKVHSLNLFGIEPTKASISTCASQALYEAVKKGNPVLLEPLMEVNVQTTEEYLGNVLSDLRSFDMKVHSFGVMNEDRIKSVIQEMRERVQIQHPELNQS
ncbi:10590_t:CDS:2 [Entrophospora sp. SA101]|nr:10590_t:CDS:2 [Entrophospora sp. SA101]CAJ0885002.1 1918_t:CDS:2 [Entrophospora sp. SA101]